jgi:hypothetical protein
MRATYYLLTALGYEYLQWEFVHQTAHLDLRIAVTCTTGSNYTMKCILLPS